MQMQRINSCTNTPASQKGTTTTRFELARAEPIGVQNQLLNHSDMLSGYYATLKRNFPTEFFVSEQEIPERETTDAHG
jgi:hypothetical protein